MEMKEFARDLIAFGSVPFLILTIIRVSFMNQLYYPLEFVIGSAIFFVLRAVFKAEMRAGIGMILLAFTSLYYKNALFSVFAAIVYGGIIYSLFYLKREKRQIIHGILFGVISVVMAYVIVMVK